ncbi:hypothetical protein KJ966_04110 [bacterium]|nr:hypothetical protein [bacterium]
MKKPGGINSKEISKLNAIAKANNTQIFIAYTYNRRFYSSVLYVQEMIEEDGGVSSFNFEFTEWSHIIKKLNKPQKVLANWFYANSTHVVDLAFYLGGKPKEFCSYTAGSTEWHPKSVFSGAGITVSGVLFSYQANWNAPGRWGVEILTKQHRYYFRPMEELHI